MELYSTGVAEPPASELERERRKSARGFAEASHFHRARFLPRSQSGSSLIEADVAVLLCTSAVSAVETRERLDDFKETRGRFHDAGFYADFN